MAGLTENLLGMLRPLILLFFLVPGSSVAQNYYYPPGEGSDWETIEGSSLGWNTMLYDSLFRFLDDHHSKSFLVLYQGRIAIEWYADDFGPEKWWYWASAGKSLTASLVGIAQQKDWLDINQKTSDILGDGWTRAPADKEALITIRHQLTMTTGLDDRVDDQNCLDPECLNYRADAGTRWFYYNAPYRLLEDVLAKAGGMNINQVTNTLLGNQIGMGGLWLDYVRWGTARDMARFGLFALSEGSWAGKVVLDDPAYFYDMIHSSQSLNPSYGYLWWLNGYDSYILPGFGFSWPGPIIPDAPADLYAALGKDDQKIYVVPSKDLVVVRQGNKAVPEALLALSPFDNELWHLLQAIIGGSTSSRSLDQRSDAIKVYPNPARMDQPVCINNPGPALNGKLVDPSGKVMWTGVVATGQNLYHFPVKHSGIFFLTVNGQGSLPKTSKLFFY